MINRISIEEMEIAVQATSALVPPAVNAANATKLQMNQGKAAPSGFSQGNATILFDPEIGCGFMRTVRDEAKSLTEPMWWAGMSIVAVCDNARELAHDISKPYENYNANETDQKLKQVSESKYGPATCQYIRDNFGECCVGCPHNVKSPAVLATQPKYARLLDAKEVILKALAAVEGGNTAAHLAPEVITAFALVKKTMLAKYGEWREILKTNKAPLGDFEKEVGKELKEVQSVSFPPPLEPIYAETVKRLEGTAYHLNEHGHLCTVDNDGKAVLISEIVVKPLKQIGRDDGMNCETRFEVLGIAEGGEELGSELVNKSDLDSLNFMTNKWGLKARVNPSGNSYALLKDSVYVLGKKVPVETLYTHTGWRKIGGKWVFLHGGGAIGGTGVRIELQDTNKSCILPIPPEEVKESVAAALSLRHIAPYSVTVPVLSAIFLAPLCEAARQADVEPEFVLWLCGRTGSMKTTLVLLALQHFGPYTRPPATFKDTGNAVALKAFLAKDIPLLIDDYHPVGTYSEARTMTGLAAYVLRLYGDRIGKGRLTAKIELQESKPPRGIAIVTGEDAPPGGESDVARTFVCPTKKGDIDIAKLTKAQKEKHLLSQAMAAYILWLQPKMDGLSEKLAQRFEKYRSYFQPMSAHGRTGESAAWLLIGWEMFVRFAKEKEVIGADTAKKMQNNARITIEKLVEEQSRIVRMHQPSTVFLEVLAEMLTSGKVSVRKINTKSVRSSISDPTWIGYIDDDFYYLFPEETYNRVNQFLKASDQRVGITSRALWEHLHEDGHIETELENQGTDKERKMYLKKKKVDSSPDRPRLLWLKRDSIDVSLGSSSAVE